MVKSGSSSAYLFGFGLQSDWFRVFRVARCLDGDDPFAADDGDLVARCFDGDAGWDTL